MVLTQQKRQEADAAGEARVDGGQVVVQHAQWGVYTRLRDAAEVAAEMSDADQDPLLG